MKTLHDPAVKADVLRRLGTLGNDSVRRWGRMNVEQMICHLADSFRFALGDVPGSELRFPLPAFLVRWVGLHLPLPWMKGAPTLPEFDQLKGGTPPTSLDGDRTELMELIERFVAKAERWPEHPVMGRLSREEWGIWGYRHLDHHLRQFGA